MLNNVGMTYPGLNNISKSQLYRSIRLPTLTYGMDCINLSSKDNATLNSVQGGIIKQMCGLGKRSRHTNLLRAMNIDNISTVIGNYTKSVFKRVCSQESMFSSFIWLYGKWYYCPGNNC